MNRTLAETTPGARTGATTRAPRTTSNGKMDGWDVLRTFTLRGPKFDLDAVDAAAYAAHKGAPQPSAVTIDPKRPSDFEIYERLANPKFDLNEVDRAAYRNNGAPKKGASS